MNKSYRNPILPGCYPDPSICRVGEDYYMVCSSFEFFPGLPIFHSRDLVNWCQIGHALDRESQLNLDRIPVWNGLWAPTIRYHEGTFYIINTLTEFDVQIPERTRGNFVVTATDPAGPWSDPAWIADAPGIDPSLLFDDDGRVWYVGNREGDQYDQHGEIWLQELDLSTMKLVGARHVIWDGALKGACCCEGPHIYKINGWYYLLTSEGGTGIDHAVAIARSREVTGPYVGHIKNPILTNRNCGWKHPIACTGHADLVDTADGQWWMVLLAVRPYGDDLCSLGRETFMVPVIWEEDWPVACRGSGKVEFEYEAPALPEHAWPPETMRDDFDGDSLRFCWNFLRTPRGDFWSLSERPGHLRLRPKTERLTELENPAFVGRRQQHINFTATTCIDFAPQTDSEAAGLAMVQNKDFNCRFLISGREVRRAKVIVCTSEGQRVLTDVPVPADTRYLKIEADGPAHSFYVGSSPDEWVSVVEGVDGRQFSMEITGPIAGFYIGMLAECEDETLRGHVDFDWFEYQGE